jgi:hypothetical protein
VLEGLRLIVVVLMAPGGLAGLLTRALRTARERVVRWWPRATGLREADSPSVELRGVAMVIEARRAEETEVMQ